MCPAALCPRFLFLCLPETGEEGIRERGGASTPQRRKLFVRPGPLHSDGGLPDPFQPLV